MLTMLAWLLPDGSTTSYVGLRVSGWVATGRQRRVGVLKFQTGVVIAAVAMAAIGAGCNIPDAPKTSSSIKPVTSKPSSSLAKGEKIENAKAKPAIKPADNGPPPTTATTPAPAG